MPKKYDPLKELKKQEVSIWRRGFAFLVDIIIIQFIVNLNFNKFLEDSLGSDKSLIDLFNTGLKNYSTLQPKLLLISIVTAIAALIYFTLMEFKLRQTLGKMIFKIKVVQDTKKLEFWQVLLRNVPKALFFVNYTIWVFLIDILYYSFTRKRLFDRIAKTDVENIK